MDDGSEDETGRLARAAGGRVERHARRTGKGAALRTGLLRAYELGCQWAITLDGDGQHEPGMIPEFLECVSRSGAALVVGNRMAEASAMSRVRRAGWHLPDSQRGFRLINLDAWHGLRIEALHFEVESEMLMAFLSAGYRVEFVPVPVIPAGRPSRIRAAADSGRWLVWWRRSIRRASPVLPDSAPQPI